MILKDVEIFLGRDICQFNYNNSILIVMFFTDSLVIDSPTKIKPLYSSGVYIGKTSKYIFSPKIKRMDSY